MLKYSTIFSCSANLSNFSSIYEINEKAALTSYVGFLCVLCMLENHYVPKLLSAKIYTLEIAYYLSIQALYIQNLPF